MNIDFKNKRVLVTGATRGIGKSIADEFANLGAQLILTGTKADQIKELNASGDPNRKYYCVDFSDTKSTRAFIKVLEKQKQIDVCVNNAGINKIDLVQDVSEKDWDRMIDVNLKAPFLNRAIKGLFPPGSVFKVPVAIGALDSQKITPHTTFECNGFYMLGGRRFRCTHSHGPQNLVESLAHSCNIYYYRAGLIIGVENMYQYARELGLGQLTHIDLPYEESGYIPNRRQKFQRHKKQWYAGDTLNFSVGQGDVLVTPLQLVRMIATVANNGTEVQPHIIKSIGGDPVEKYNIKRNVKVDRGAIKVVQEGMRAAVTNFSGTAHVLDMDQLLVAGKTGTAQSSGWKEDHSWFVGYVRGAKKNIAFCVFLEHGGSSQNACLVSKQFLLSLKSKDLI